MVQHNADERVTAFFSKVYAWMSLGLLLTAAASFVTISVPALINAVSTNPLLLIGLIVAELGLVIYLSGWIDKMGSGTAKAAFSIFALLNGITLSFVFLLYTAESIGVTFVITAGTFAIMSAYGFVTKKDLTSIGSLAFMALIGIILASIVNIFLQSTVLYWMITYIGVLLFVGLIAYDTQKLKRIGQRAAIHAEQTKKAAILGALSLYLDFINLFIMLLRIFGKRR